MATLFFPMPVAEAQKLLARRGITMSTTAIERLIEADGGQVWSRRDFETLLQNTKAATRFSAIRPTGKGDGPRRGFASRIKFATGFRAIGK